MRIKSAAEFERQIRILKRENLLLAEENKELTKENRILTAKYENLKRDVKKAYPTFTV